MINRKITNTHTDTHKPERPPARQKKERDFGACGCGCGCVRIVGKLEVALNRKKHVVVVGFDFDFPCCVVESFLKSN